MGAVTVASLSRTVRGNQQVVAGTLTMSSSYATSGDTFSLAAVGMNRLDDLKIEPGLGVLLRWDGSTSAPKVMAYRDVTPAATAAFAEVAAAQSLTATGIARFEAIGA